jgi:hypothetical protein
MTPYENDHTRLLNRHIHDADALAEKAASWADKLATAKVEASSAEEAFLSDFTPAKARDLAEAKNRVRDFAHVVEAIESAGGPAAARASALQTAAVFSALAKGFAERIATFNRLVPVALKRLGERRAVLTEQGVSAGWIENDPAVCALRAHHGAIVDAIASATAGEVYASKRGVGYAPRTFDELYALLTAPIPQAPATPAA